MPNSVFICSTLFLQWTLYISDIYLYISDRQHAHYTLPLINALWTCHFCQILSFLCDMQFHYLKYFNMFPILPVSEPCLHSTKGYYCEDRLPPSVTTVSTTWQITWKFSYSLTVSGCWNSTNDYIIIFSSVVSIYSVIL